MFYYYYQEKKNTFGYNGTGDYYKLNCSVASKLTNKNIKLIANIFLLVGKL